VLDDRLGNGRSDHLPDADPSFWTVQLFKDEHAALTEHLGIAGRHRVVGQSWGGMLALDHPPGPLRGDHGVLHSHSPHLEEPERFLRVVEAFLERVEGPGGGRQAASNARPRRASIASVNAPSTLASRSNHSSKSGSLPMSSRARLGSFWRDASRDSQR
jgi:hypothetical protein